MDFKKGMWVKYEAQANGAAAIRLNGSIGKVVGTLTDPEYIRVSWDSGPILYNDIADTYRAKGFVHPVFHENIQVFHRPGKRPDGRRW